MSFRAGSNKAAMAFRAPRHLAVAVRATQAPVESNMVGGAFTDVGCAVIHCRLGEGLVAAVASRQLLYSCSIHGCAQSVGAASYDSGSEHPCHWFLSRHHGVLGLLAHDCNLLFRLLCSSRITHALAIDLYTVWEHVDMSTDV
jgi:hypothetical protein